MKLRPAVVLALVSGVLALGAACSVGSYPVDVFPEQHYQESFRSGEPPRLPPAPESVPITGKEVAYTFGEASGLANPAPDTPEAVAQGAEVYRVNCSFCHGPGGRGDGPMREFFPPGEGGPVDFASFRVRARADGELYWILTNGLGVMPEYKRYLTPDERWLLVRFIRSVKER